MVSKYVAFNIIPLGTRFRYDSRKYDLKSLWVKISANEIAEWDESQIETNWVGQKVCSYCDNDDDLTEEVEVSREYSVAKIQERLGNGNDS